MMYKNGKAYTYEKCSEYSQKEKRKIILIFYQNRVFWYPILWNITSLAGIIIFEYILGMCVLLLSSRYAPLFP